MLTTTRRRKHTDTITNGIRNFIEIISSDDCSVCVVVVASAVAVVAGGAGV
jgi:hypothetical protein